MANAQEAHDLWVQNQRKSAAKIFPAAPKPEDKEVDELDKDMLRLVIRWGELPGASDADKEIGKQASACLDELNPSRRIPRNLDLKDLVARIGDDRSKKAAEEAEKKAGGVSTSAEAEQQSDQAERQSDQAEQQNKPPA